MNIFFYKTNIPTDITLDPTQNTMYCSKFNLNVENANSGPYDYYVVPIFFRTLQLEQDKSYKYLQVYLDSLDYFKQHPSKHVFILQSDYNALEILSQYKVKIFCDSSNIQDDHIYPLPFFVHGLERLENIEALNSKEISTAKFDLSFRGCVISDRTGLRQRMLTEIKKYKNQLKLDICEKDRYFWSCKLNDKQVHLERKLYFESITDSKFVLCPKGAGSTSARFFETIWFGRIPILIADDTKLPLEHMIPWNNLIVKVSERDMDMHEKIQNFLNTKNIEQVSLKLRTISRKYFDRKFLPELIKLELKEKQIL